MVHKCANPECDRQYRYFREGRLFEFQVDRDGQYYPPTTPTPSAREREIFWLCDECSRTMVLECKGGSVVTMKGAARNIA